MKQKRRSIFLCMVMLCLASVRVWANPVLHAYEPKFFDRGLLRGIYLIQIRAMDMESAAAQLINYYESRGWGVNGKDYYYSGVTLLFEYAALPSEVLPIDTKLRTAALQSTMEFLTNKTKGYYRTVLIDNRVLVIRRQKDSLLYGIQVDNPDRKTTTVYDALQQLVAQANREQSSYRIRLEKPTVIRPRATLGTPDWVVFNQIPAEKILQRKVSVDFTGGTLAEGIASVLMSQPYPLYLSLKPDRIGSQYSHVLGFDTLLRDMPEDLIYKNSDYRYNYLNQNTSN